MLMIHLTLHVLMMTLQLHSSNLSQKQIKRKIGVVWYLHENFVARKMEKIIF